MSRPAHILMVLTSSATMGAGGEPTGLWFEELATPYYIFIDAGAAVTLASIAGGAAPVDPRSVTPEGKSNTSVGRFLADLPASAALAETLR